MQKRIQLMKPNVGKEELELVSQVFKSGFLVEGKMVEELEKIVAKYTNTNYAIACTSATTGLELALRAVGISPEDEVIIPDFTHPATGLVIGTLLAHPVLVDVNLKTANTTASLIAEAITPKTKAIIPVSMFGNPLEMEDILKVAKGYKLPVIEDAACSLGSEWHNVPVGSMADISVFSLHPRKIFTTGDGGIITTSDFGLAAKIRAMKKFGVVNGKFMNWGTNYRMSDILGAVALGQIRRLDKILRDRRLCAKRYDALLENVKGLRLLNIPSYVKSNYQTYCVYIESEKRDDIIARMNQVSIETQIGAYALHELPVLEEARRVGSLSNSSKLYKHLLALPLHHELTFRDQLRVVSTLMRML